METDGLVQRNGYDGEGLSFELEENGERQRFVYDGQELISERTEGKEKHYFRGHDLLASEECGKTQYYIQDEMRSVLFLLDEKQEIVKSYRYDAFGES